MSNLSDKLDIYTACYLYSLWHHNGQWSRSYRLGCIVQKKGFHPGLSVEIDGLEALGERGFALYQHLKDVNY